ncbi:MAG: CoA-binding protein [Thermodesulfobacteriota bacterium]
MIMSQGRQVFSNLASLFSPRSVAVIGASDNPGKLGFHVMKSLTAGGFKGVILPVNPGSGSVMGIPAVPSVRTHEGPVDLAVVVLPSRAVPAVFEECAAKGVKGIVLITAGFKEIEDPRGAELQLRLREMADQAGMAVIGPNTFGMVNLSRDLNASFTPEFSRLRKGGVSLVSQSGGISHLLAFMAMRQNGYFSKIIGLGNRLNVDFPEMLAYLMEDPDTRVILLYMEGVEQGRRLLEVAREKRGRKPVIAYKTGRARTSDRASFSHTGSLAGRHEVYEGALRQAGILSMDDAEGFLDAARVLASCPLPRGRRVAVLSGQAGPGMAACDVCEAGGMEIVSFSPETQQRINELLPPLALRTNPVDMGPAWYNSEATAGILRAVLDDDRVDAVLLLTMFASANRDAVSGISKLFRGWSQGKPLVTCLISPPGIWDAEVMNLESAGVLVNIPTPERAATALASLWQYRKILDEATYGSR